MASLSITQTSPIQHTVSVAQTVSPVNVEVTEQITQNTVVVSPQNITNYYGGGGEVVAALTGVTAGATNLGTFTGDVIADNETIKGALQDLEDGVENNEAAISTNATDIQTNANDITGVSSVANSNFTTLTSIQTDLANEIIDRQDGDNALTTAINANTASISTNATAINNIVEGELTQELDPTETQLFFSDPGTFAIGTSVESILRQMLIHFQPPSMSVAGWNTGTYEHGAAYQDSAFTLSFSNFSNVNVSDTGVASFSDTYIANGTNTTITAAATQSVSFFRSGTLLVDNGTPAGLSGTATQRYNAARLTVNGFTDTQGTGITGTSVGSTVRYRYWVLSNTTRIDFGNLNTTNGTALITSSSSLSGSGADTIESNLLSSIGNLSINSAGTYDYVYWIYPTAWTVNNINNPLGLPIYTGDTTGSTTEAINYIGTFTLTNQHSADVSMTVLRTKNSGALGSGTYTVS